MSALSTLSVNVTSKTYSLENAFDAIRSKSANKPTLLLCLFVGRSDELPLPEEEGTLWVSLDIRPSEFPLDKQIHLQMDFNNPAQMKLISGLFDKVVLDQSTLKLITNDEPWVLLGKLLKPKPGSLLISEADTGEYLLCRRDKLESHSYFKRGNYIPPLEELIEEEQQKTAFLINYRNTIGNEQYEKDLQTFKNSLNPKVVEKYPEVKIENAFQNTIIKQQEQFAITVVDKYKRLSEEKALPYLQTLFSSVTLVQDKPYPYTTRYKPSHYYILEGPKFPID